jgi:hypothetical protein
VSPKLNENNVKISLIMANILHNDVFVGLEIDSRAFRVLSDDLQTSSGTRNSDFSRLQGQRTRITAQYVHAMTKQRR